MRIRSLAVLISGLMLAFASAAPQVQAQREAPDNQRRAQLEQAVRQRVARALKERVGLSDEQLELLYALDRLFLRRSEWASQRDRPASVADITDEFTHEGQEPATDRRP